MRLSDPPAPLATALADRYHIERELGRGGMAIVYLAEDLKHRRKVAIKVLRPELAAVLGVDRFLQEIALTAPLQHPHILPLHDSGIAGSFPYYVMPYIDGPSVRQRLVRDGEFPVVDAVRILRDVADALAHAHRHGVVHRDIKPENVMLSGRHAFVTDFGIAKAVSMAAGQDALTTVGIALGTPSYMAPEQAVADPHTDHRADIYSFGIMAYELLAGQPPFTGPTPQAVLVAQATGAVEPVTRHRASIPPALAALVMQCLEKRPADRPQSADELITRLEGALAHGDGITPTDTQPLAGARPARSRILTPVIAGVLLLALGITAVRVLRPQPLSFTTANAVPVTSEAGVEFQPALSPDGKQLAYVVQRGRKVIAIRSSAAVTGSGEVRPAEGEPGNQRYPAWSADGEFVRFWSCPFGPEDQPRRVPCGWKEVAQLGGAVRPLDLPRQHPTMAWSRDGKRAAFVANDSIFAFKVGDSSAGLLAVHPDPWDQHSLAWSPDGRWIAYVNSNPFWRDWPNTAPSSIWLVAASGGKRQQVVGGGINVSPAWLDARHLLFVSDRDGQREVYAVDVTSTGPRGEPHKLPGGTDAHSISVTRDGRRLAVAKYLLRQNVLTFPIGTSGPMSLRDGLVVTSGTQRVESQDVSRGGQWLVYDSNLGSKGNARIYKLRLDGGAPVQLAINTNGFAPRWSPDGREVVFYGALGSDSSGSVTLGSALWLAPAEGGAASRLTDARGVDQGPMWSPDGLRIAFRSVRSGRTEVWLLTREHVGGPWRKPEKLTDFGCFAMAWMTDGSGVLCRQFDGKTYALVSPSGAVLWRRDMSQSWGDGAPVFSPDGSTIYAQVTFGGRNGIWAFPWKRAGAPRLLITGDTLLTLAIGISAMSATRDRLYLVAGQAESDIWVMDLEP